MNRLCALALSAAALGCAAAPRDHGAPPAPCPAPRLIASSLIVGDGARDRGFPGGVSLVDVDNDGDLDLMATGGYSTVGARPVYRANTLYLNDGAGGFTHAADPEFSIADNANSGSTWADIDGDGDLDAFIGVQHGRPDVFLRNLGGARFARESLGEATTTRGSNFAASWVDMDGDGDLDLMSGGPTLELGAPLHVFRNDASVFTRVTGLAIENGPTANAGAILWADYDNDGDQDLFVANSDILRASNMTPGDIEAPQYYRNDGNWSFVRTQGQGFDDRAYASVGAARGDIDGDGDLDLYLGHSGYGGANPRDRIFINDGAGRFALDTRFEGHAHRDAQGFGAQFVDLDLDGDLDLLTTVWNEAPRLFINDGAGAFTYAEGALFGARAAPYTGVAAGDLDSDGDIDVALGSWGETADGDYVTILRNDSERCGASVRIALRTRAGAPDPIGARVTLVSRGRAGERRQLREASGQSSFRSQNGDEFLFGLPHGERAMRAEVRWPDGRAQIITRLAANRVNVVIERPARASAM